MLLEPPQTSNGSIIERHESAPPIYIGDPQLLVPQLELVQVDLHPITLPVPARRPYRVLRDPWGEVRRISPSFPRVGLASRLARAGRGLPPLPQ